MLLLGLGGLVKFIFGLLVSMVWVVGCLVVVFVVQLFVYFEDGDWMYFWEEEVGEDF